MVYTTACDTQLNNPPDAFPVVTKGGGGEGGVRKIERFIMTIL